MTILVWFVFAFAAWLVINIVAYGILDWQGRRQMRRRNPDNTWRKRCR